MKKIIPLLIGSILYFSSCTSDSGTNPPPSASSAGVYVINEGLFGQNNSSITFYDIETGNVSNNVYNLANNNASLGDNANGMFIIGNKGYIAVDNSNKIEIIDLTTFKSQGFIDLGQNGSPRHIWMKDSTTGYVTSLYTNQVIKFETTTNFTTPISVGSNPDGMAEANNKLFVANSAFQINNSENKVSVIDLTADFVITNVSVGYNPTEVIAGADGNIYVVCTGSYTDTTIFSGVYKIDSNTNFVLDSIEVKDNPGDACFAESNKLLVINADGIQSINTDFNSKPVQLISAMTVNNIFGVIYSIAYDPTEKKIYLGNPKDFQQNGEVAIFDLNGNELKRFNTGINPGSIVIK